MRVAELMETDLIVTTPDTTLHELDELLSMHGISGAPVVDDEGHLVGIISQSDVVRVLYEQQERAVEVSQYLMNPFPIPMPSIQAISIDRAKVLDNLLRCSVREVMTDVPVVVSPDDHVRDAAQKMIDALVHRVLVTKDEELVGLLSALDLAQLVATDL